VEQEMKKTVSMVITMVVYGIIFSGSVAAQPGKETKRNPKVIPQATGPFQGQSPGYDSARLQQPQTLSLDVKETDIGDAIRMISKGYGLNIILDREVTGKITLHLTDVPILEGLNTLAKSNNWELVKEGSVFRIRKPVEKESAIIRFSKDKLTVDVQNMDVLDFIKEISSKTAVSIVADNSLSGKVNGKLYDVSLDDGIKAILSGSGFGVSKKRNIYYVTQGTTSTPQTPSYDRMRRPQSQGNKNTIECVDGRLTIDVVDGPLAEVMNTISEQCNVQMVTYEKLAGEVDAKLNNIPLTEALALLLGGTRFTFVQRDSVILIGDRNSATPSGQTLSKSEMIHLKHIKADDVPQILPKNIPINNVKVIKEQNALLISGTSEDIVQTMEFLETVDIPTPQVVIDVLVVEYTRNNSKDFGWGFGWGGRKNTTGTTDQVSDFGSFPELQATTTKASLIETFSNISALKNATILKNLPSGFYAYLNLLEQQNKAKVLAQPSITVLNGNKAKIDVGQTQYYQVKGGTENNPTLDFRPINFGISLNITPWISKSGQITAEISPEISNSPGMNKNSNYPDISRRSVSTTVRINNGETLILGGLLKTEETVSHVKVPILGDIPILGYLFRQSLKRNTQTNLVVYITPHLVDETNVIDLSQELKKFDINEKHGDAKTDIYDRATQYTSEKGSIEENRKRDKAAQKKRLDDLRLIDGKPDSTPALPDRGVKKHDVSDSDRNIRLHDNTDSNSLLINQPVSDTVFKKQ
jgi:type IV pilus assembly protein PilQ